MLLGTRARLLRCTLVWSTGSAGLAGAALAAGQAAAEACTLLRTGAFGRLPLDRALADLAAGVVVACALWGWLAMSATVLDAVRIGVHTVDRAGRTGCRLPPGVRRLVLAACGVALVSATASPTLAADGGQRAHHGVALLSGLPLPDRAVAPARSPDALRHPASRRRIVVVTPGDSLWSIAEDHLPPGASDRRITTRWRAVYAANRARVGPDPDVIEPGQRLLLPPGPPTARHLRRKDRP